MIEYSIVQVFDGNLHHIPFLLLYVNKYDVQKKKKKEKKLKKKLFSNRTGDISDN